MQVGDLAIRATYTNGTEVVREFYAYDHEGRVTAATNALGNVTTTDYDARGNAIAVDGATYPVRKSYDSENRQISLRTTRDGGETWDETKWTYDDLTGLLLAKTYADGSQMTHTYTPDGLPARTTYPGGKWKELVYDDTRAVTNILHAARSTPNTAFLHDAFGNITNATDTAGNAWQFSYIHNSTLTNEVFTSPRLCDSARQTNALTRLIDAYSRPIGYDLAIGSTPCSRVRYGYDVEGRIATLVATNTANRGFQVSYLNEAGYNYGYTLTTPNGATLTRTVTRDPYRRSLTLDCTTRFNNVEVATFAYTFDAGNRPVTRNNDRFAYNDRDEILSAVIGTNNINRAYDTIGNHVFCAFNSATNFYANNQLNQTTASYRCAPTSASDDATPQDDATPPLFDGYDILSTNKFTWSAQGGLQRDGRFIYAFDAEDQLTSVTSSHLTNGAIRVLNAYDYRHRRIAKTVYSMRDDSPPTSLLAPPSPIVHRTWCLKERHDFVYDDWNLIHETVTTVDANSATNVTEIEYFWGPDLSNSLQGAGGVGGLLAVSRNGQFYFPIYDNLGNVVKYLDESGNIVTSYTYDDFGRILTATGTLASSFNILFSTKYFDSETDFYYYGHRFYSLVSLSWLNRDSIEEIGSVNLYEFDFNSPLEFVDYLGNAVFMILGGKDSGRLSFPREKKNFHTALKYTRSALDKASTITEYRYYCCRRKGQVYFAGVKFSGTLEEFRNKIRRELKSKIVEYPSRKSTYDAVVNLSKDAQESYDFLVLAAHGTESWSNKLKTDIWFSDGPERQDVVKRQFLKHAQKAKASRVFVSCYQDWRPKGTNEKRPSNEKEIVKHYFPMLIVKQDRIEYVQYKVEREKWNGR